jgi:hypothetical protein
VKKARTVIVTVPVPVNFVGTRVNLLLDTRVAA